MTTELIVALAMRLIDLAMEAMREGRKVTREEVNQEVNAAFTRADAAERAWKEAGEENDNA